jgi:hypothetical protein
VDIGNGDINVTAVGEIVLIGGAVRSGIEASVRMQVLVSAAFGPSRHAAPALTEQVTRSSRGVGVAACTA